LYSTEEDIKSILEELNTMINLRKGIYNISIQPLVVGQGNKPLEGLKEL
jgi:hypothetical protein